MVEPDLFATLNEDERRIAVFLVDGLNTSEIAKRLSLPYRTVADAAKAIRLRLGVSDLEELRKLAGKLSR